MLDTINFKSTPNTINFNNPKPRKREEMPVDMSMPEDIVILNDINNAQKKEKSKEKWQKAGVVAQVGLAAAFLGLFVMEIMKYGFNKKVQKIQEEQFKIQAEQFKRQFPDMANDIANNLEKLKEVFKDFSKDKSIPELSGKSINPKVKKFIKEVIEALNVKPEIAEYTGSELPPRMLLLYGPTGTGKTFTAKVFAKAQGAEYTEVQFSDVSSKYVGETAVFITRKFKEFAELAKANPDKKYVVAFNEIDSLINNVEKLGENNLHLGQNRTSFLNGLDSIKDIPNLTIVGTTNINPNTANLDAATLGRFGNIFEIPLPNKEELKASLIWQLKDCMAAQKHHFLELNENAIDEFLDQMVARKCAHRDMETIVKGALNKFKLAIKDMPDALEQKFDIKYLQEALDEKEVIASGIGNGKPAFLPEISQKKNGGFWKRLFNLNN